MAEDADESLPGVALFFAQGPAEIGQDEQFVRQTALAKCASPHSPSSGAAGKAQRERRVFIGIEATAAGRDRSPAGRATCPSAAPSKFSPARLTRRNRRSGSKVKTATSISAMIGAQQRGRFEGAQDVARAAFRRAH